MHNESIPHSKIRPADLMGPPAQPALDGVSAAVYGLVLPETRAAVQRLWAEQPHLLFERAYEDSQDAAHGQFIDAWRAWVSPHVDGLDGFRHQYVTNGSSEAIRESIWTLAKSAQGSGTPAQLHVFAGEYEGYVAYARAAGIDIVAHERTSWRDVTFASGTTHRWYVSQPSAADGNVWPDFAEFVRVLEARGVEVAVDFAYVGAVPSLATIDLSAPNVVHVFFSLSKVFGVFYHRIGGMLSRTPLLGLEGNKWFKNMFSLYLGATLLRETPSPLTLPARYRPVQEESIRLLTARHNVPLAPSNVILLAWSPSGDYPPAFKRGARYRWCLTPTMDRLLSPSP